MFLVRRMPLVVVALAAVTLSGRAADESKFLPNDTKAVLSINIKQFLSSELIKQTGLDKMVTGEDAKAAFKELGMNPFTDLDRILVSATDKEDTMFQIIALGRFDVATLRAKAEEASKAKKENFKAHKTEFGPIFELAQLDQVVPVPPQAQGQVNLRNKSLFMTVVDKETMVMAPTKEQVEVALAKAAGKQTTKLQTEGLAELVSKIDAKQTMAVAIPGAMTMTEKIKSITGGITVGADVRMEMLISASDLAAAKELSEQIGDGIQAAMGFANAFAQQQPALKPVVDILNGIKHETKDKDVTVKTTIAAATLADLFKALATLQQKGGF